MTAIRKFVGLNSLMLGAIGVSTIATATSPVTPPLVFSLLALLALVLASAYSLVTNPASRCWGQIVCFLLGFSCLTVIAIGSL